MGTRSVWIKDPVNVVAQIYDGCNWKGQTTRHSEALQGFWHRAWSISYIRSKGLRLSIPGSYSWHEVMWITHRSEVQVYRKMTRKELKALAHVMKADYPEPLFCIVVAMCMTKLKSEEKP